MNTLLTTNILLLAIVIAILVMSILVSVLLIQLIGTTRRIKHLVTMLDDDVIRARSFIGAVKDALAGMIKKK